MSFASQTSQLVFRVTPGIGWREFHAGAHLLKGGLKSKKPRNNTRMGRTTRMPAKSIKPRELPTSSSSVLGQRPGKLITAPREPTELVEPRRRGRPPPKVGGYGLKPRAKAAAESKFQREESPHSDFDIPEEFKEFHPERRSRSLRERDEDRDIYPNPRARKRENNLRVFRPPPSSDERRSHPDDASGLLPPPRLPPSLSLSANLPKDHQRMFKELEISRISVKAYEEREKERFARRQPLPGSMEAENGGGRAVAGGEFVTPPLVDKKSELSKTFDVPGLLPGLYRSVISLLSPSPESVTLHEEPDANYLSPKPTPIQGLALKHVLGAPRDFGGEWLLASETGSGKSLAYFLPVLNGLKESELAPDRDNSKDGPRALILAPTHELTRQLATTAKALSHNIKLRVVCSSKPNRQLKTKASPRAMADMADSIVDGSRGAEGASGRMIDVLTGTPMSILEAVRGKGWNWEWRAENEKRGVIYSEGEKPIVPKGVEMYKGWVDEPKIGLGAVEWVVVDEADVLFDEDFQETTRALLSDIATAKGAPVSPTGPVSYPFNLILTSATIPASLSHYLSTHHPSLTRLASPRLHRLPVTLKTEHVAWSGGSKNTDIEARIRRVWAEDALKHADGKLRMSKILIFCNKRSRVTDLKEFLEGKDIRCVGLTGDKWDNVRQRGSNRHLDGFLRTKEAPIDIEGADTPATSPHVLITTSLLSRGLDFSPRVKHVFIVDEPRNMLDFLHRAGRSGRAGHKGSVVVFGRGSGRGSESSRDVKRLVGRMS